MLRQHHVLRNLRKNKDTIITTPHKGNGVDILDWKRYDSAIQEIISDLYQLKTLNEDPTLNREASLQHILCKLKEEKKI